MRAQQAVAARKAKAKLAALATKRRLVERRLVGQEPSKPESRADRVLPLALLFLAPLLLFVLALAPRRALPQGWLVRALEPRREDLAWLGIAVLILIAFLLVAT